MLRGKGLSPTRKPLRIYSLSLIELNEELCKPVRPHDACIAILIALVLLSVVGLVVASGKAGHTILLRFECAALAFSWTTALLALLRRFYNPRSVLHALPLSSMAGLVGFTLMVLGDFIPPAMPWKFAFGFIGNCLILLNIGDWIFRRKRPAAVSQAGR